MLRRTFSLLAVGGLALAIVLGTVACGDDDKDSNGAGTPAVATATEAAGQPTAAGTTEPSGEASSVNVNLLEYKVNPDTDSAPAGDVTFDISNIGGAEHEFMIVKSDLAAEDLPTSADGSFDASGAGVEVIDEIHGIAAGAEETTTLSLEAAAYILLCNIVDDTTSISHFAEGMHTAFTVTE